MEWISRGYLEKSKFFSDLIFVHLERIEEINDVKIQNIENLIFHKSGIFQVVDSEEISEIWYS
jgi:hypothetical protein